MVTKYNRMQLLKISGNNRCFLFEDRLQQLFKVYKLNKQSKSKNKRRGTRQGRQYIFEPLYEIDILKLRVIARYFCKKKSDVTYSAVVNHIKECGQLRIDDFGNIDITFNSYKPKFDTNGQPTDKNTFGIFVSIIKRSSEVRNFMLTQFEEYYFKTEVQCDQAEITKIRDRIQSSIAEHLNLLEIEAMQQQNLPEILKDERKTISLKKSIFQLKADL